jgi:hypothetical protein
MITIYGIYGINHIQSQMNGNEGYGGRIVQEDFPLIGFPSSRFPVLGYPVFGGFSFNSAAQ